jgi:hypothetical protein
MSAMSRLSESFPTRHRPDFDTASIGGTTGSEQAEEA